MGISWRIYDTTEAFNNAAIKGAPLLCFELTLIRCGDGRLGIEEIGGGAPFQCWWWTFYFELIKSISIWTYYKLEFIAN